MKKEFTIMLTTTLGIGAIKKKATTHIEAFKKLCISDQKRTLSIFAEDGDEIFIDELLETI